MKEYIDFNSRLREIYQEAEQETIRLILESGLTEVILSDECDIAYAHHDNGCGLNEDAVTIVKVGEMDNGDKYLMFKCEGKDEEPIEVVSFSEFTLSNTLDEKIKDVEKMFKHYNYLCKPENSFSLNSKVREKMVEKMKQVINVYNQIKKEN